jgi:hypothetical protein
MPKSVEVELPEGVELARDAGLEPVGQASKVIITALNSTSKSIVEPPKRPMYLFELTENRMSDICEK